MAGKRTIAPSVHRRIRRMVDAGHSRATILKQVGCSRYTYRVATQPGFREAEAARHRERYPTRHQDRLARSRGYSEYRAAYFASGDYRAAVRKRARARRSKHATPPQA